MSTLFHKIGNEKTLSQQVEGKIEQVIREKKILPGEKLPTENELCTMFGVSRTALREALRMLSARGLISIKKGSGIYVNDYSSAHVTKPMSLFLELNFDRNYVMHLIKVRQILEPSIARMAAENRSENDLSKLRKITEKFINCREDDYQKEGELDKDFHMLLAEASGNPIIPVMVQPIFELMPKIRTLVYAHVDHARSTAVELHQRILDNIERKDAEGAFKAMNDHLILAQQHSEDVIEVFIEKVEAKRQDKIVTD
jgi:GntR family transcriptional repressor for pyruvate dehydrogenase complex